MGNANGRKRHADFISQDELSSPEAKRPRLHMQPSSSSTSCTNTLTSSESSSSCTPKNRNGRFSSFPRFNSRPSSRVETPKEPIRLHNTHSCDGISHAHGNGITDVEHSLSLTSLSRHRDFPTPWLEALFLPSFPARPPPEFASCSNASSMGDIIGSGAFGTVRRVRVKGVEGGWCAVKCQEKAAILRRASAERVKIEVDVMKHLPSHPFITQFYAAWQTRTHLYSAQQYSNLFEDLSTVWRKHGLFSESAVRVVLAQLSCAIAYLHSQQVLFRDVKMDNVLLDSQGTLLLTDFGLARPLRRDERAFTICGTLQYMAPEVASCNARLGYGTSADWWSMAVLAHVLLTGRYPYPNAECTHHTQLVFVDYATPLERSDDISRLFDAMLHPNIAKRLSTFGEISSHVFFTPIDWRLVEMRKYPLHPHLEWSQLERRRRLTRHLRELANEETDDDEESESMEDDVTSEQFQHFDEQYDFRT